MLLIADSGSTKTNWCLINNKNKTFYFSSTGLNPYFIGSSEIKKELRKRIIPFVESKKINEIFFYGAGCSVHKKCDIVKNALNELFPSSYIEINSDLLGAARALLGNKPGIAGILGTGSNCCYYDGKKIKQKIISLGFILGDEGSGADIGKKFIKSYLENKLPSDIKAIFEKNFHLSTVEVLHFIYNKSHPSKFLASFVPFISENIKNDFLYNIVHTSITEYFKNQVITMSDFKNRKFSCIGSIAFAFKDIVSKTAKENNINLNKIIKDPVPELINFHLKKTSVK
ncbi:MAG: ATPase [Bacteroidales bacterium]|jgi:N-acetylglucosamine kinase-like BadF-type ATPase